MAARDMVLTRLNVETSNCNIALTEFRTYIVFQRTSFSALPDSIAYVLGEDPRATLYAPQLQYYIDRIFNTAESIVILIQQDMANIEVLLNNEHLLSTGQLFAIKERLDNLLCVLKKLVDISSEKAIAFLNHFAVFIENLISEKDVQ